MTRRARRPRVRLMLLALAMGVFALSAATAQAKRPDIKLQLLTFNDYHGWLETPTGADATLGAALDPANNVVGGGEYLATTLATLRSGARNSLTATAGDLIGGTPFLSGLFHDEPSVESLDAMGLDVSGVGNHEFDEGLTELLRMQNGGCHPVDGCYFPEAPFSGAKFRWLAANVIHQDTGKTVLPATWIKRVQGVKVGFIGMTLEDTPVLVAQAGIRGLDFLDEVEAANTAVRSLKRRGVKTIIVLLHEGGLQTGTYGDCTGISGPIVQIAQNLDPEIDFIASGHTHQPYICNVPDPKGRARMVTSASSFGRVVTESWLTINPGSGNVRRNLVTSTNHLVLRTVAKDPAQTAILAKWNAKAAPIANRVVGTVTTNITRSPTRATESDLANLIADAQLTATQAPADGGAQIALMNPGGVRADLTFAPNANIPTDQPGQVTFGEAFTVQPFGNLLVSMDLTGAQLERVLEQQAVLGRAGGRDVLILGISRGLNFTYCTNCPFGERIDPLSITLNGLPVTPLSTYRVTVNSFLADGGDAFTVLREGTNRLGGGDDLAALTSYLTANSPIVSPGTDRITEITAPTP